MAQTMNKYYQKDIIERFMTDEELAAFDQNYRNNRIPQPFSRWGTDKDRVDYLRFLESKKNLKEADKL